MATPTPSRPRNKAFLGNRRTTEAHHLRKEQTNCQIDEMVRAGNAVTFVPDALDSSPGGLRQLPLVPRPVHPLSCSRLSAPRKRCAPPRSRPGIRYLRPLPAGADCCRDVDRSCYGPRGRANVHSYRRSAEPGGNPCATRRMDMPSERVSADCPECGRSFSITIQDVIRGRKVSCPGGHQVQLVDEGGEAAKMERELRKIDPNFRL